MANENGNGTFKRWVFGAVSALLVLWLSWASASINTLNTKSAVTDTQYSYIKSSLDKIEHMLTEHLKETRNK
jgi:hypothetical protein